MRALFALFIRSMREDTRAKLPPILRAAMVTIVLFILWAAHRDFQYRSGAGRNLLAMVMMLNAAFLAVAAVSIFPTAITEEKEDETLPLLRMTNLSPVSILLGKGAPRLVGAMLLLIVQIPFSLLAITLGGVTLAQVLGCYAILASAAVFLCGLALVSSVFCRTALRAGFMTGILGAIVYAGLPMLGIATVLQRMRPGALSANTSAEAFFTWVMEANPIYGIMVMLHQSPEFPVFSTVWKNVLGGAVCFCFAWLLFDRFCTQVGEGTPRARKAAKPGVRKRWFEIPRTWRWPLVWKDFHFMVGGRKGFVLRCLFGAILYFAVYAFLAYYTNSRRGYSYYDDDRFFWEQLGGSILAIGMGCMGLELLLITSRIFGDERRRLTLSSLVSLPWSTWRIIWQKVVGCLPAFIPWILLSACSLFGNWEEIKKELRYVGRDMTWETVRQWTWESVYGELGIALYVCAQAILLLQVIAWYSLRIRRGALPAGIATMAVWNILFGVSVDSAGHEYEADIVYTGLFLSVPMIFIMCRAIVKRIQLAAAAD